MTLGLLRRVAPASRASVEGMGMARWTGHPEIEIVLAGAQAWRDRCLLSDGSLLTDQPLWTGDNVAELHRRFVDNPIEGSDQKFYEKLASQIAPASAPIKQLAAEALWFTILFPNTFGPEAKRERVEQAWGWSGGPLVPTTDYLQPEYLLGVGNAGTGYMTRLPHEFGFLLDVVARWKQRPDAAGPLNASDASAWAFAQWLDGVPGADSRPMRNALLFFLFPDQFERNLSTGHRAEIYVGLKGMIPAAERPAEKIPRGLELDQTILKIRRVLEDRLGSNELDFYLPPLVSMWRNDSRDKRRKSVVSAIEAVLGNYNLDLNQTGSKKRFLHDTRDVDESTGYWSDPTDATNKPLRWLIHFDLRDEGITAHVPTGLDGQIRHGARRIAFANTAQGRSGGVLVRIIPAFQVEDDRLEFFETWEWLLMLNFLPNLPVGSAAQLLDDFDPEAGTLRYMGREQRYIFAGLIALNDDDSTYVTEVGGQVRTVSYSDTTKALADLLHVRLPEAPEAPEAPETPETSEAPEAPEALVHEEAPANGE